MSPVERAIRALRRGDPVRLGALVVAAVETAPSPDRPIVISRARAAALKLVNQRAAADADHAVTLAAVADPLALADPTRDLARPMQGPFRAVATPNPADTAAALKLARLAGLLPALHLVEGAAAVAVTAVDVDAFDAPAALAEVARARLPVAAGAGEIVAFRGSDGGPEHLALILGRPVLAEPVLTRLHSSCLTGDVLGSLRCDCGPQLAAALARIGSAGGLLLYLNQEGRGIGLVNKLRAYALQDQGFDTLDANLRLGLPADARNFRLAAAMLRALGVRAVRLLTNNPAKVAALEEAGVRVTERVPLTEGAGPENASYRATKASRAGHIL